MNERKILPNVSGIYKITCLVNNKIYLGSSIKIRNRISRHIMDLRNNRHSNMYLQNAFNKYGEIYFTVSVIELCPVDDLCKVEQFYLDNLLPFKDGNGYNIYKVAYSPRGHKHTDKQKEKISNSLMGHTTSDETRRKIGDAHRGKIMSFSAKEANRKWHTGIKQSEESIRKRARSYSFIKDGIIYKGINLKRFSQQHGLTRGALNGVLRGERKHHKGFYQYNN